MKRNTNKLSSSLVVILVTIGLLMTVSCQKGGESEGEKDQDKGHSIKMNYTIDDGLSFDVESRSTAATDTESRISEVTMIFYKDATYVDHVVVNASSSGTGGVIDIKLPATMQDLEESQGEYTVIVLGNFSNYAADANGTKITSNAYITPEFKILNYLTAQASVKFTSFGPIVSLLPMHALAEFSIPPPPVESDLVMAVEFARCVSRIDVYNYATGFTLESAIIYNYRKSIHPFAANEDDKVYEIDIAKGKTPPAVADAGKIIGGLYCFPNTVTIPTQDDNKTTYLMISGLYGGTLGYYRANIIRDDDKFSQAMTRNERSKVSIYAVTEAGVAEEGLVSGAASYIRTTLLDENLKRTETDEDGNYIYAEKTRVVLKGTAPVLIDIEVNPLKGWTQAVVSGAFFEAEIIPNTDIPVNRSKGQLKITQITSPTSSVLTGSVTISQDPTIGFTLPITVIQPSE